MEALTNEHKLSGKLNTFITLQVGRIEAQMSQQSPIPLGN